jgi:hypothetical protein
MQTPIDITFRDMTPSPALELTIYEWARRLDGMSEPQRCSVVIETPHKHHLRGRMFQITLDIAIPGHQIVVSREHANPHVAVADAFRAARRQMIDFTAARREARPAI